MESNKKELDALNLLPNKQNNRIDVITPHKITVVFLVQEYLNVKHQNLSGGAGNCSTTAAGGGGATGTSSARPSASTDDAKTPLKCNAFATPTGCGAENTPTTASKQGGGGGGDQFPAKYRRQFCMLLLKLIQYPDLPYKELHGLLTSSLYGIHPNHLKYFENLMELLCRAGIEILFDLQNFIDHLMSESIGVNQFGILGLYIRRIVLAMDKLSFPEMMALYQQIKQYYEKGIRAIAITPSSQQQHQSTGLADSDFDINHIKSTTNRWSVRQADLFVAQQCNLLENNETRALTPIELQSRLTEIINDNPLYAQAHILSLKNNLRVRDFVNSLTAFHRAFDRSAVNYHNPPETKGFQYSSLNLAIMHAQFNHTDEALTSLRECVMLAQECGDRVCLQLAETWLCLLDKSYVQLCEKSVATQTEQCLVHSVSLGVQFIVNVAAISGFVPAKLFELLMKSEVINFQHSLMDLIANSMAQKAAIWTLYGKNEIASLCSQLLLTVVRTHVKREHDSMENGEGVCHALCCIAMWLALQAEYTLSAVVLQHARERFPRDPLARNWMICLQYVNSLQAMFNLQWEVAGRACCQLYVLDARVGLLQRSSMNLLRRNVSTARRLLEQLLMDPVLEPLYRVRAMILLAHTMIVADTDDHSGQYQQQVQGDVINVLNEAAVYAKSKYLAYEVATIDACFAYVLLAMGLPQKALRTIRACMDTILANGGAYDVAKTQFLFVRCLVAAEQCADGRRKRLTECVGILEDVAATFGRVQNEAKVRDVWIYLAREHNALGMTAERNRFSLRFRELQKEHAIRSEYFNIFF